MAKQILFDDEAKIKILKGARSLNDTMKITFGPTGRNVILDKSYGSPETAKGGNAIAKEIELPDPFENMGAKMVAEAVEKISDTVGDGSTLTALLTTTIYEEGLKYLTAGVNPAKLKQGIDRAVETIVKELKQDSTPIKNRSDYEHIATIAANRDPHIGKLIAQALEKVGKEGIITIEEGKKIQTNLEFADGLEFDKGYISPYFVNKAEHLTCELENAAILVYEKKISNIQELVPLLEQVAQTGSSLLIIAEEVEGEALAALVINQLKGVLKVCAVKAPAFGDRKKSMLEDISILTGGKMLSEELGIKLENANLAELGRARFIKVEKEKTTIIEGAGNKTQIKARIQQLRNQIKETTSDYDREKLEERLAKFQGGVALIQVGAPTESELKDKKALAENALNAAKAARAEGILPGGGVAYLKTIAKLKELESKTKDEYIKFGIKIVAQVLKKPLQQIAYNSGWDGATVMAEVQNKPKGVGFDANSGKFVNMLSNGIIDPTKVLRLALQNAASVAGLMLTTRTLLTDLKKEKEAVAGTMR